MMSFEMMEDLEPRRLMSVAHHFAHRHAVVATPPAVTADPGPDGTDVQGGPNDGASDGTPDLAETSGTDTDNVQSTTESDATTTGTVTAASVHPAALHRRHRIRHH